MGRRRRGKKIDGWIILDKPLGLSSTAAVGAIKRALHPQKAGHGGTLDPLATGVLPVGLGEATKTMPFITDSTKIYEFEVCWGEARNTDDREGEVTETSDHRPSPADIDAALGGFIGEIEQVPPAFSAIKINGERAYKLARAGEAPEMRARSVLVENLERLDARDEDHTSLRLTCGKGTYVRALARDLALVLTTAVTFADVVETLREVEPPAPVRFDAVDRYEGPPLEQGQSSLTVRVSLQPLDQTLTEGQAESYRRALVSRLEERLAVRIRT